MATASAAAWPLLVSTQENGAATSKLFQHGVASGDPLADRVILWTRVTPSRTLNGSGPMAVRWQVASDERLTQTIASDFRLTFVILDGCHLIQSQHRSAG